MDEHLGYEKNSVAGNHSGNSCKHDVCTVAPKCGMDAAQLTAAAFAAYIIHLQ